MFSSRNLTLFWFLSVVGLAVLAQTDNGEEKKDDSEIEVEMVVSASRKAEKKLEAPSTIETVTEAAFSKTNTAGFLAAAAQVKGVDYVSGGISLQRINARGFTTSFQSRMLRTKNGRLQTLPGAGVPQDTVASTTTLDIKKVEFVLGPASALYGANASSGVLNVITKTPWDEKGTAVRLRGGEQSLFEGQLRHAGISSDGRWGWKVTGSVITADDFDSPNVYFADGSNQTTHSPEETAAALRRDNPNPLTWAWREDELADFSIYGNRWEVTGYFQENNYRLSGGYSWTDNDGFTTTNLGRNRLKGYEVETLHFEVSHPRFFLQASRTGNDGGDTYGIQNVTPALAAGLPLDTIVSDPNIALVFDQSSMIDLEGQVNQTWGNLEVIAGISYREFSPDSGGTYLDDGGELPFHTEISREETGVYAQLDLRLLEEKLRLTGAVRRDESNEFDAETSPKFSVTYTEGNHNFRAGFNKAHRVPSILENHLHFARVAALGNINVALGNPVGWNVFDLQGNQVASFPGLVPEIVETLEVGYRGVVGNWVIDGVIYDSSYENFVSALQTIAAVQAGTVAVRADGEYAGVGPFPGWPLVLTYLNYGEAEVSGYDFGVDYIGKNFQANISYGHTELDSFTNSTAIPDLPFNTPENRIKGSLNFSDVFVENSFISFLVRAVTDDYTYVSGRWSGVVESHTIVNFSAGYEWEKQNMTLKLDVSNLFDQDTIEQPGLVQVPRFFALELVKKF
ncbi:MAG: TonB-dependent receptor plug domain-containing protein [Acidobacteriota bacterium]|nr:TonB-dependent receptor plug domain-containing protein [Acidobacteriota bacterium]